MQIQRERGATRGGGGKPRLLAEEILWLLEGRVPDPLAIPWITAQVSKLGFDADQAFQIVMMTRPHDAEARRDFFAEVDRFADLMP